MQSPTDSQSTEPVQLCYLDAKQIEGPLGDFEGAEIRTDSDGKVGHLDGIVVDPTERRVRYLVVEDEGYLNRRYLVPIDATRVDVEGHALCVEGDNADMRQYEEFNRDAFRSFSFRPR